MAHFAKAYWTVLVAALVCASGAQAQDDYGSTEWEWFSGSGSGDGYWVPNTEPPVTEPPVETEDATGDVYTTPAPIPVPECEIEQRVDICNRYPKG